MYKVLVVEDEVTLRRGLVRFIRWEDYGCTVCGEAQNGVEGLAMIRSHRPDIVFTDVKMPSMDGLEMLRHAREEYPFEAVIISGYGEFDYARQAMVVGVADFLLKPVDREELTRVLTKLVAGLNRRENLSPGQPAAEGEGAMSRYTRAAIGFIAQNYQNKITAGDIAESLGLSADHLGRVFRKDTGATLHDFLTRFRIEKACALLEHNRNVKVYEVAELVGFGEYKYFHRVFTKHRGTSPTRYKKHLEGG